MANPTISQNRVPSTPQLKDLLDMLKKDIFLSLNCHAIGTVQSFNSSLQTATATINYKKTYFVTNPQTNSYDPVLKDYPILLDCPVVVLGGGPTALTFPITEGDECLVMFNDRDIDNWFQSGQIGPVATPRMHSFSDGIILVGVRSLANTIEEYDNSRAVLRYGQTMVGVGESLIKIANATTTLNTLLQDLVDAIKNITVDLSGVTPGMGSVPNGGTVSIASIASLVSIASDIEELLE